MITLESVSLNRLQPQLKVMFHRHGKRVTAKTWQGVEIADKPDMIPIELLNVSFSCPLNTTDLEAYRLSLKPNLPWADDHFQERVCGQPINPGLEWANWPWGESAKKFIHEYGMFDHNYMERYWPRFAGTSEQPTFAASNFFHPQTQEHISDVIGEPPLQGIRFEYGDLHDLLNELLEDPLTRQSYLPMYFPEDTGRKGRKPCSLGYHFIMRDKQLHVVYYLRSCDFVRHFADDMYLTIRLLVWMLEWLRLRNPMWEEVEPGTLTTHITSLHVFRGDWQKWMMG